MKQETDVEAIKSLEADPEGRKEEPGKLKTLPYCKKQVLNTFQ